MSVHSLICYFFCACCKAHSKEKALGRERLVRIGSWIVIMAVSNYRLPTLAGVNHAAIHNSIVPVFPGHVLLGLKSQVRFMENLHR